MRDASPQDGRGEMRFTLGKRPLSALLLSALSGVTGHLLAQSAQTLRVDLSTLDASKTTTDVLPSAGKFAVLVVNRLPSPVYKYAIVVTIKERAMPPITLPAFESNTPVAVTDVTKLPLKIHRVHTTCSDTKITGANTSLLGLTDEAGVPSVLEQVAKDVDTTDAAIATLDSACRADAKTVRALMRSTESQQEIPVITPGQDVIVNITRTGEKSSDNKNWTLAYNGMDRGSWVTTYGFAFLADLFSEDESYTSRPIGTSGMYQILKDAHRAPLKYVPTIFFSWQPNNDSELTPFLGGGLGFDLSNPVVEVSAGLSWNKNLSLHLGLAAAKVGKLMGKYNPGDTIAANLSADQLTESVYRVNPFFALSFNFNKSPFGGGKAQAPSGSGSATITEAKDSSKVVRKDSTSLQRL